MSVKFISKSNEHKLLKFKLIHSVFAHKIICSYTPQLIFEFYSAYKLKCDITEAGCSNL